MENKQEQNPGSALSTTTSSLRLLIKYVFSFEETQELAAKYLTCGKKHFSKENMISPNSHHKGNSWKVNKDRPVLWLKICEHCKNDRFQTQNWKAERAHVGLGVCAVAARAGQLSGSHHQGTCVCFSLCLSPPLPAWRRPWSHAPAFPVCGFIAPSACI